MTQENGRSLPVLCRVLSQNHTRVFLVERGGREGKGRWGERNKEKGRRVGREKRKKDEVREDIHMHVLHAYTNPINVFV